MKIPKIVGWIAIIAGVGMFIAGLTTYVMVSQQLAAEKITVPADSKMMPGAPVVGPFSAYAQAEIINEHALSSTEGKTYAELGALKSQADKDGNKELSDKYAAQRTSIMNASFLRASLFTSVVAFGVAALVMGLGVLSALIGWALLKLVTKEEVLVPSTANRGIDPEPATA